MPKRHYKKKALPVRIGETAPKQRAQHGGVIMETIDRDARGMALTKRQRSIAECVLDVYFLRQFIDEAEYEAGMIFRKAYLRAVLRVRVEDAGAGCHGELGMEPLMIVHSEYLLRKAYKALPVTEQAVIVAVCGHDAWAGNGYRSMLLHSGLRVLANLWKVG
ncbi:MAG: hypothetical protein P4N59_05565 [Negativicutes bacterium]|nr:hypothetical protein [Negativicutes bacterium]